MSFLIYIPGCHQAGQGHDLNLVSYIGSTQEIRVRRESLSVAVRILQETAAQNTTLE